MNLEEQRKIGIDKINVTDALNASLLELKLETNASMISPNNTDLIVYVDSVDKTNPSALRREYIFPINEELKYLTQSTGENIADKFVIKMRIEDNDVVMDTYVERKLEINEVNELSPLEFPSYEKLESIPIVLFEGNNYIYTNYEGINIELVYPQNTEENRLMINSAMFYSHKINNSGDFSLDDIYFKDAFTKTEDKLNLEVDNANITCLTSKNNKFSLDEDGNLTVNSISYNEQNLPGASLDFNQIYPVGSIYLSVNNTNPSTLFGGTWTQIMDRFLLAAGNTYANGSTGGSANLQAHTHSIPSLSGTAQSNGAHNHTLGADKDTYYVKSGAQGWSMHNNSPSGAGYAFYSGTQGAHTHNVTTNSSTSGSTGSGGAENMPPYLAVCIWQRTA